MQLEPSALQQQFRVGGARTPRVFYQIFPDLSYQPADATFDWFEIALHAATQARPLLPGDHDELGVALQQLAGSLLSELSPAQRTHAWISPRYYSTVPQSLGSLDHEPRLCISVSLVLTNVQRYQRDTVDPHLIHMATRLRHLRLANVEAPRPS